MTDDKTTIATLIAQLAEAQTELTRLREGLTEIANRHVPDQPMADGSDEAGYIRKHHTILRVMARDLLEGSKPTALSSIKREAEDAGIKIGLRAAARSAEHFGDMCGECNWPDEAVIVGGNVANDIASSILALTPDEARKLGEEE